MNLRERPVRVGLSLMPTEDARLANQELFDAGEVDAIEWSVDFGWGPTAAPAWVMELVGAFAERGAAYAHGVELSPMSAVLGAEQEQWLSELARATKATRYQHLTEHYGFMTAGEFVRGTPLPLPPSRAAIGLAADRIARLCDLSGLPVGIENLAFAYSPRDVWAQAELISELLERTGAFLLLDVHNVLCQAENFELPALSICRAYPLERAREIHFAGGAISFTRREGRRFRRDSHDDAAPEVLLDLTEQVLPLCPALEVVILERSDRSLFGAAEAGRHRAEFRALRSRVAALRKLDATPTREARDSFLLADSAEALDQYQSTVLSVLERAEEPAAAKAALLAAPGLAPYGAHIESYEQPALEIAIDMVRQWASRRPREDEMVAAVLREPRSPLELRSLPIPAPGPGQVLIEACAVGLCGTDAHAWQGFFPVPMPIVLGHEIVGRVAALGEGARGLALGDRVGVSWVQRGCGQCPACARGQQQRCPEPRTWVENGGGLSQWLVAEDAGCTRLPEGLADELAAPLFCAGHVALSALKRAALAPGDRVAVLGVGGLGHLALQIAKAWGHEVLALSSSPEKLADARSFGADAGALIHGAADVGDALTEAGGADVVIATTSSAAQAAAAVRGLRAGGRLVLVGLSAETMAIDPLELVQREASLIGAIQGSRRELDEVLALAAQGRVRPRVESYPLALAQRALGRLVEGRVRYRAVVT